MLSRWLGGKNAKSSSSRTTCWATSSELSARLNRKRSRDQIGAFIAGLFAFGRSSCQARTRCAGLLPPHFGNTGARAGRPRWLVAVRMFVHKGSSSCASHLSSPSPTTKNDVTELGSGLVHSHQG